MTDNNRGLVTPEQADAETDRRLRGIVDARREDIDAILRGGAGYAPIGPSPDDDSAAAGMLAALLLGVVIGWTTAAVVFGFAWWAA